MNGVLYRMAQREEGVTPKGPPVKDERDRYLVKYPRSWVQKAKDLAAAGHTRKFNFIGALRDLSAESSYPMGVRDWIAPFVSKHLAADYYKDTNPAPETKLLGPYDHSQEKRNFTKQQKSYENDEVPFDETYFRTLCESEFTLAPAGDLPYSNRFMEAILCGSIPIVDKEEYANCEHHQYYAKVKLSKQIGWHFYIAKEDPAFEYVYNRTWAEENLQKAIRYHTLMTGFNDDELYRQAGEQPLPAAAAAAAPVSTKAEEQPAMPEAKREVTAAAAAAPVAPPPPPPAAAAPVPPQAEEQPATPEAKREVVAPSASEAAPDAAEVAVAPAPPAAEARSSVPSAASAEAKTALPSTTSGTPHPAAAAAPPPGLLVHSGVAPSGAAARWLLAGGLLWLL
ncbi:unnamed protein product [Prorocentrum cordatum]|uniref:RXYLT1 C-terminal domain-containing protein n=2 Tax=Prorocentrum cordatum TaxID=2364126 RepID=A0ABN9T0Q8_9DINO|nr:unnamed protein product [Polarella glacialis]